MIPEDFIATLLGRVDIVELVDRYVPLKKAGANYVACCPFHREKTPSFTVSPTKQFYHCFGCGAHGTAIGFLMEYGGKPFVEAVEELARNVGLPVPRTGHSAGEDRGENARSLELLLAAGRYYKRQLKQSPRAIEYLRGRGLTGQIAARFGIGFAPDAWQGLAEAVDDYQDPALERAGLVITGEAARRYDRFRDRIMFPILDSRGQVIGFGGRVLDKGEPKYLNSPETPLFSKGRELYGLFQARQSIRDSGQVIVVEGYMDVVALAQYGIENAVATLGTSTTATHAAKLLRYADTVIFCFDADDAGRRAAWRALEATLGVVTDGKEVRFLFLPEGMDPDDHVRAHGADAFRGLAASATPLSELLLAELVRLHPPVSAEGKAALVAAARPYLDQLQAPVLSAILRRRLAELSGLASAEVAPLRSAARARTTGSAPGTAAASRPTPSDARSLLKTLLAHPSLAVRLADWRSDEGSDEARALNTVLDVLADARAATGIGTAALLESLRDSPDAALLWRLAAQVDETGLDVASAEAELEALIARRNAQDDAKRVQALLASSTLGELTAEQRAWVARFRKDAGPLPARSGPADGGEEPPTEI
jgi:DNA primase